MPMSPEEITLAKAYELLVAHFGIIPAGKMAPDLKVKYSKSEREHTVIFESKSTDKEICRVYVNNKGEAVLFRIAL